MIRLSRDTWLDAALGVLVDEGPEALTVDRLCRATAKTKGSFYHHFPGGAADLVEQLLAHFRRRHFDAVAPPAAARRDPSAQHVALDEASLRLDGRVERALRAWALREPRVAAALRALDEQRLVVLADLLVREAGLSRREANDRAAIEYAAFVGFVAVFPDADPRWAARLAAKLRGWVLQPPASAARRSAR